MDLWQQIQSVNILFSLLEMETFRKFSGYLFLVIILIVLILLGIISTLMYTSVEPVPNAFLDANGNVISGTPNYASQLKIYSLISSAVAFITSIGIIAYFFCAFYSKSKAAQ
jgi:hypothetical protein